MMEMREDEEVGLPCYQSLLSWPQVKIGLFKHVKKHDADHN